jgi:hypothetical protein
MRNEALNARACALEDILSLQRHRRISEKVILVLSEQKLLDALEARVGDMDPSKVLQRRYREFRISCQ